LNAFGYDGKIKLVKATEAGPIAGVAGFRYHQLSYKTRGMEGYADGTDWAGIPSGPIQSVPNSQDVFSYDLWSGIPYLGLGYEFTCFKRLHGSVECDYSQWASVKDRDRHMLQNSRYESQTDGTAWIFNLTLRYDVTAQWFAMFMADSLSVDTDGETTKMVYQPTAASPRAMMYHGPIEISERETRVSVGVGRRL
jgi:outer membrane protease